MNFDPFGFGMFEQRGPVKAFDMLKQYRREYYELDAALNKARRAAEMHPEKYVMGFMINPTLIYEREAAKSRYEMTLELVKMLDSKPEEPKAKTDGNVIKWRSLIDEQKKRNEERGS